MTNEERAEYVKLVKRERQLITRHQLKLKELLTQCDHADTVPKSSYFSGSYYDTASTTYWDECVICQERLNVREESHGYYG